MLLNIKYNKMSSNAFGNLQFIYNGGPSRIRNDKFENNLYYTLCDIVDNSKVHNPYDIEPYDLISKLYMGLIWNPETKRREIFYTDVLNNLLYVNRLLSWLNTITRYEFISVNINFVDNKDAYSLFDDWWNDFVVIRKEVEKLYNELLLKQ